MQEAPNSLKRYIESQPNATKAVPSKGETFRGVFFRDKEIVLILKPFMREGLMSLPVTFISTISRNGVRNIAPWSCVMPYCDPWT